MGAHGHEEEEEEITPRLDGPPFVDIKAKQGLGFDVDFDSVQKHLGPGKLALSDFMRDMDIINKTYSPIAHKSLLWLKIGNLGMMAGFIIMIIMGIIGGTPASRKIVMSLSLCVFLAGLASFVYSKIIEQGLIRASAEAVKKVVDEVVQPRYADSPHKLRWVVTVHVLKKRAYHMGKEMVERPVITIYCLRSPNAEGVLTDWELPELLTHGLLIKESLHGEED